MSKIKKWKIISIDDVSPSPRFPIFRKTFQLPNGKIFDDYYTSRLGNVAMVVPITKSGEVIFVRKYKHGVEEILLGFPARRIKNGCRSKEAARDELLEETGIQARNLQYLGKVYPAPVKGSTSVFIYLAKDVEVTRQQDFDSIEDIEIHKLKFSDVLTLIRKGEIKGSDTIAAIAIASIKFPNLLKISNPCCDKVSLSESRKLKRWEVVSEEDVSPSHWYPVYKQKIRLPDGSIIDDYYASRYKNASMILPITKEKEIIFERQYRQGVDDILVELPAGEIRGNISPEDTARMELDEETGIVSENLIYLGEVYQAPTKSSVRMKGYLAEDVVISKAQNLEETEDIEILKIPVFKIFEYIQKGRIQNSDTIAMLFMAKLKFPALFV
ncbi:MAG: NUDIX hydrolase [Patescibacteria group bacterium]|nr:NUDIX hydrolase [Patescibacteria group bacterium]